MQLCIHINGEKVMQGLIEKTLYKTCIWVHFQTSCPKKQEQNFNEFLWTKYNVLMRNILPIWLIRMNLFYVSQPFHKSPTQLLLLSSMWLKSGIEDRFLSHLLLSFTFRLTQFPLKILMSFDFIFSISLYFVYWINAIFPANSWNRLKLWMSQNCQRYKYNFIELSSLRWENKRHLVSFFS